jgi:hypothetical protein
MVVMEIMGSTIDLSGSEPEILERKGDIDIL